MISTSGKFRAASARLKAPTLRRQRRVPITCECSHLYSLPVSDYLLITSGLFAGYVQSTTNPRGVLLGFLVGGVPPGSPNPDPISDQKMSFSTDQFSDLAFRQKLCHHYLD